jgi:hypothetical protein
LRPCLPDSLCHLLEVIRLDADEDTDGFAIRGQHEVILLSQGSHVPRPIPKFPCGYELHY